jgi:hypothetical protein
VVKVENSLVLSRMTSVTEVPTDVIKVFSFVVPGTTES